MIYQRLNKLFYSFVPVLLELCCCKNYHNSQHLCFSVPCPAGYEWVSSTMQCRACPVDTYRAEDDGAVCIPCPYGFESDPGASSEDLCERMLFIVRFCWFHSYNEYYCLIPMPN